MNFSGWDATDLAGKRRISLIYWEVTDICNHNCIHCFNYWREPGFAHTVNADASEESFLEIAREIVKIGPKDVVLTGGEPLTVFGFLKPSMELLLSKGIRVTINTNASILTEEMAEFLWENKIGMFVSFPSYIREEFETITSVKGSYDRVVENLVMAREKRTPFSFNCVISKVNINSIFDTARFLKSTFDIKRLSITRVSMPSNAKESFFEYLLTDEEYQLYTRECVRVKNELGIRVRASSPNIPCSIADAEAFNLFAYKSICTAGKSSFVISADAKTRACVRDSVQYGDIRKESAEVIYERMLSWRDDSLVPTECKGCPAVNLCGGGCRTDAFAVCNRLDATANYFNKDRKMRRIRDVYKPVFIMDFRDNLEKIYRSNMWRRTP